jgi:hypothetical protein
MEKGSQGVSTLIIRTSIGEILVRGSEQADYLNLQSIEKSEIMGNIGLEIKKHGFGYHLQNRKRWNWPVPSYNIDIDYTPIPRKINIQHPHLK